MGSPLSKRPGQTIRSVQIAFNTIDYLQEEADIDVMRIADELGHSKSTVHSRPRTLEERRVIVREGDGYRLGPRFLDVASHARDQIDSFDIVQKEVDSLAEEAGEIVQFGVEEYGKVSYLRKAQGEHAVETLSRVGTQQPMHSTSLGKTILAYLSPERIEEIVAATEYEPKTANTITSPEELFEELGTIREQGYGIDDEESINGLCCVSAPVKNDGTILGATSIIGPSSRLTKDRLHSELAGYARSATNAIELNAKFS